MTLLSHRTGTLLVLLIAVLVGLRLEVRGASPTATCDMPCCEGGVQGPSCCAVKEVVLKIVDPCGCDEGGGLHLDATHLSWWLAPEEPALDPVHASPRARLVYPILAGRRAGPEPPPPRAS